MFEDGERASGSRVDLAAFVAPRTEPELAIGLAREIDPSMDRAALARAVAWIAPAIEITDSRYRSGTRTAVELVADNTSSAGYVIGPRIAAGVAPPYDAQATDLVRNGSIAQHGSTADVLDHPLNALAALAIHLAARGLRARAGDVILSGAITDAIPVASGDTIENAHRRPRHRFGHIFLTRDFEEFREAARRPRRRRPERFGRCADAVAPRDAHAERRGARRVPAV